MSDAGLSHCPDCQYDLRAHPPPNRCPECGFQFDEFTFVWRPRKSWKFYMAVIAPNAYLIVQFPILIFRWNYRLIDWTYMFISILLIGLLFWLLICVRSANKRGRYVAVTPKGIVIRQVGEPTVIAWGVVKSIEFNRAAKFGIDITTLGNARRLLHNDVTHACLSGVFGVGSSGREFIEKAQLALAHFRETAALAANAPVPKPASEVQVP